MWDSGEEEEISGSSKLKDSYKEKFSIFEDGFWVEILTVKKQNINSD